MKKTLITTLFSLFAFPSLASEPATSFKSISVTEVSDIDYIINKTGFREKTSFNNSDPQTLRLSYFFDLTRDNTSVPLLNYWKIYLKKAPSCVSNYQLSLINIKTNHTINFSLPHNKGIFLSCLASFTSNLYHVDFISDKYIVLHISGYLLLVDLENATIKKPVIKTGYDSVNLIPYNNQWIISVLKHGKGTSFHVYDNEKNNIDIDFSKIKIQTLTNINNKWEDIQRNQHTNNHGDKNLIFKNYTTVEEFDQFYTFNKP